MIRYWLRRGALLVVGAVLMTVAVATPAAAGATSGPFHLRFAHSSKCLDDPNYITDNGTWLDQWTCVNQTNEEWYFDYTADGTQFRIRGVSSNMCVTAGNVKGVETIAALFPCGDPNQYFQKLYDAATNTPPSVYWWYAPSNDLSLALNVDGASTANGAHMLCWARGAYTNEYVSLY